MHLAPEYVGYIELDDKMSGGVWSAPLPREQAKRRLPLARERDEMNVVVVVADVSALRDELDREWLLLYHKAKAMRASSPARSA
jgi:hypothetical protein